MSSSSDAAWVRLRPGVRVGPEVQDDRGHCVYVQDTSSRRMYRFDAETGGFLREASDRGASPVPLSSAIDSLAGRGEHAERGERAVHKLHQLGILEVDDASSAPATPQSTAHASGPSGSARSARSGSSGSISTPSGPGPSGFARPAASPSDSSPSASSRAGSNPSGSGRSTSSWSGSARSGSTRSGTTRPAFGRSASTRPATAHSGSALPGSTATTSASRAPAAADDAVHLFDPSALLTPVARRLGWTLGPVGGAITLLAAAVVAAVLLLDAGAVLRSAVSDAASWPWTVPVTAVVVLGLAVAREIARGAALIAWGGRCRSVALPGRPLSAVSCDLSGIADIPGRWRRSSVFLVGVGTSWVLAALLLAVWTVVPHPSAIATTLAGAGLAAAVVALVHTLPWPGSDTSHALAELRRSSLARR